MNLTPRLWPLAAAALTLLCLTALSATASAELSASQTARVLAGVDNDAFGDDASRKKAAEEYAERTQDGWEGYNRKFGKRIRKWASRKLPKASGETIFYPFAGADFPTVHRLYPGADRYVLVALQTAGRVPDLAGLPERRVEAIYRLFTEGIGNFARRGFFHTRKMNEQFEKSPVVEGITGVMMAFAIREGYDVVDVKPIKVGEDGAVEVLEANRKKRRLWDSVRLTLKRNKDGKTVLLDYLQLDLSDNNLRRNKPHRTFIRTVANNHVVLKAASHLMQQKGFRTIRDALLERAKTVWQDETGLPYRQMSKHFEVDLYGDFQRVNVLFDQEPQRALQRAYQTRDDVQNLPFQVGYRKTAGSCLQVARTRKTPVSPK